MTPGLTTTEIVRVLHSAGGKALTAKEIFALGNFDYEHTSNNGLSQMARADDSPVGREEVKSSNGNRSAFEYFIKPGADLKPWLEGDGKNGQAHAAVDIPEFVAPRGPQPAKDEFSRRAEKQAAKNAAAAQGQTVVEPAMDERRDRNPGSATHPSDGALERPMGSSPTPAAAPAKDEFSRRIEKMVEKNVAAAQPGRSVSAAPSKEGRAAGAATAAAPVAPNAVEIPAPVVSVKECPAPEKPMREPGKLSGPITLMGFDSSKDGDDALSDPFDVDIDPLLSALVVRLPVSADKWTKAQRESWLRMFNAAADFLYPESR